ncbi:MAG: cytochrome c-type biogenesis protein [Methylococcaceae bacterium]|jgi:cytochrome c-type biogenesis protein CcmH
MKIGFLCIIVLTVSTAIAGVEYRQFSNAAEQKTYENLISELRCLVCQNQTIADSNADLAKDLRQQVFEMVQQGKSKQDITDFMTSRYGDFVLYNPPFKAKTGILWLAPIMLLTTGFCAVFFFVRSKAKTARVTLEPERQQQMHRLLEEEDPN